jgi:drug/metabolite transporter (DMT)-like permease
MTLTHLKMIAASVFFGSYLIASKLILQEAPVFTATLVRLVSAALVLGIYIQFRRSDAWRMPSIRDLFILFLQSALGVFLFSIFAMNGVSLTGGIESGVILSTVPIAVTIIALIFFGERLTLQRSIGVVLSVAGAASISAMALSRSSPDHAQEYTLLGPALLFCAVACEAVFLTFGRFLSEPLPPERLSLVLALIGAALFIPPAAMEDNGFLHANYSLKTWGLMIYTGVAINGIAAVLIYDSMDKVDTTVAAAFTALTPVSGTLLAILFLNEKMNSSHLIGMLLVISGVFVVATTPTTQKTSRERLLFGEQIKN